MKKLLFLFVTLFVCLTTYGQDFKKCVLIETTQGEKLEYYISSMPRLTQDNDKVTLTTDNTSIEFSVENLKKVYVSEANYKVVYMVDGEVYKTYYHHAGISVPQEPAPTKDGCKFSGWSNEPTVMPSQDVVVTGTFSTMKFKLTYKIDGNVYKTYDVECGATITPEPAPVKEGYTFSGWSDIPAKMPANDVTITGTFTINKYHLIYKVDGTEYKSFEVEYNAAITPLEAPTKEGHTFSGWSEIPNKMPAHDVTVTGSFSVNMYKLIYKVDGEVYKSLEIEYGKSISPEAEPTKEGYTFSGWSDIPAKMPAYDVTITGSFTINKYKLVYKVDGAVYRTYEIKYGATITPEPEPKKEGCTFSGWSEIPETMPAHDVVVTGSFSVGQFTLTYMVDGSVYKVYHLDFGASITPESAPTKEGYTFSGWSKIPNTMPAEDVVVTGSFTINTYTLTYKVDGEVYKSLRIKYGATITPEPAPTKKGYTFSGWSWIPSTMPAEDVVVTGSFTAKEFTLTYMIDGEVYKTIKIECGATITPEAAPQKEGYTFSGWSWIPSTMPAEDVVVTGSFTANIYTLTYKVDGNDYLYVYLKFGDPITPAPTPEKEGYTFSGWSWIPSTMPAENVIVSGTFTVNKYTVTYMIDSAVFLTESVEYGANIIPPSVPERTGYEFAWGEYPKTMPAHDVTITGVYTELTGIDNVSISKGTVITGEECFYVSGLQPRENVILFNVAGECIKSYQASSDGDLTISLTKLIKGVYIIKTNRQTIKITRK